MTKTGYAEHCNKSANYLHRAISVGGYLLLVARRFCCDSCVSGSRLASLPLLNKLSTISGSGSSLETSEHTDITKKPELFFRTRFLFPRKDFVRKAPELRQIHEG